MRKRDAKESNGAKASAQGALSRGAAQWVGLALVIGLFAWLMSNYFVPAFYAGVDDSAYMLEAKVLARTGQPVFHAAGPLVFTSENMVERAPLEFVAKYPPGYPLLCAAGYSAAGVKGAMAVNLLMGMAAVMGTFVLLRGFVSPMLALAGTVTLALHPMTLLYSTGALSHISETAFCVWGFAAMLAWSRKGGWAWAGAGAMLLAYACTIRYTAALAALPALVLVVPRVLAMWRAGEKARLAREIGAMAAGGALGLAPLLWYQWAAFGSIFTTGYALTHESGAFSWAWFTQHAGYVLLTLSRPGYGLVVLFPLALAWIGYAAVKDRRRGLFFAAWIIPPLLLYMSYYWFPREESKANYVRFFFQLFPPVIVAAMLAVQRLARRSAAMETIAAMGVGLIAAASFALGGALKELDRTLSVFPEQAAALVNRGVPRGEAVVCDLHLAYFAVFATDAEVYSSDYFDANYVRQFGGGMEPGGRQVTDSLRARLLGEAMGGRSQAALDGILAEFLLQRASRGMYVLTTPERVDFWRRRLAGRAELAVVEESAYESVLLRVKAPRGPVRADAGREDSPSRE